MKQNTNEVRRTQGPLKAELLSRGAYHELTTTDRAYVAGFLDRSCFLGIIRYSDRGRPKYTVRINVQCSNRQTLKPLCRLLGGSIQKRQETFAWSLAGRERCAELFRILLPYLHVRKKAAERIIQFDSEWTRLRYPYEDHETLARRDRFVNESLGLKMSWRGE